MPKNPSSPAEDQKQTRDLADEAEDLSAEEAAAAASDNAEGVADPRENPEKLKENRRKLGVDEEHETPEMKEQHRGTFP